MVNKDIQLKITTAIDNAKAAATIGDVKKSLKELQSLSLEYADTNKEAFNQVAAAAAELKDRVDDVREATNSIKGDSIEKLTGSFSLMAEGLLSLDFDKATQGADFLADAISNFNVDEIATKFDNFKASLDKVGTAIGEKLGDKAKSTVEGLGKVVSGLGTAFTKTLGGDLKGALGGVGTAFQGLGQIIKANPIMTIVSVVALIIANFDKLVAMGGLVGEMFKKIGEAVQWVIDLFFKFTDAIGLTNKAQTDLAKASADYAKQHATEIDAMIADELRWAKIKKSTAAEIANIQIKGLTQQWKEARKAREDFEKANPSPLIVGGFSTPSYDSSKLVGEQKKTYKELLENENKYLNESNFVNAEYEAKETERLKKYAEDTETIKAQLIPNATARANKLLEIDAKRRKEEIAAEGFYGKELYDLNQAIDDKLIADKRANNEKAAKENATANKAANEKAIAERLKQEKAWADLWKDGLSAEIKSFEEKNKVIALDDKLTAEEKFDLTNKNLFEIKSIYDRFYEELGMTQQESLVKQKEIDKQIKDGADEINRIKKAKAKETFDNLNAILQLESDNFIATQELKKDKIQKDADYEISLIKDNDLKKQLIQKQANADKKAIDLETLAWEKEYQQRLLDNDASFKEQKLANNALDLTGMLDAINARYAAEENALAESHAKQLEEARRHNKDLNELEKQQSAERVELAMKETSDKVKAAASYAGQAIGLASNIMSAIKEFSDVRASNESIGRKRSEQEELAFRKKQFQREKNYATVMAGINTAAAVAIALATYPWPWSLIPAAAAGVAGGIQIAAIQSKQFNPESSGGGTSSSPVGTASTSTMVGGSNTNNGVAAGTLYNIGNTPTTNSPGGGGPQRVYVTESDITDSQKRVRVIEDNATLKLGK